MFEELLEDPVMGDEKQEKQANLALHGSSLASWIAVIFAVVCTIASVIWTQSQANSATQYELANHTQEITALTQAVNNEQTLLYAIQNQLAALTQRIDDQQSANNNSQNQR